MKKKHRTTRGSRRTQARPVATRHSSERSDCQKHWDQERSDMPRGAHRGRGEQGRSFEEGVGVSGKRRERQERHAERKGQKKKKLEIDHQSTRTSSLC
ncbi:hypothetical protein K456DRAFT_1217524 [Colletotrichum gloeosporioides 23]|nr:hypothetical protein K456DRAFT_1217524 [Colletotrichum gloeosporioides 23]